MDWRKFEETIREICEAHGFKVSFRRVFRDERGRSEVDVLAERYDIVLAIDAKFYSAKRYRLSQLKREAEKHVERSRRLSKLLGKDCIPVLVSFIDDGVYSHAGCLIVPFRSFNEFLTEVHYYLSVFGFI